MVIENRMMVEGLREDYEKQRIWDSPLFDEDCTTYCEIYGCRECPRYCDDCDGRPEYGAYEEEDEDDE